MNIIYNHDKITRIMIRILKSPRILPILVTGGLFIGVLSIQLNTPSLFENLDDFVLFAQEEVKLEQDVQISSGDIGSNKNIDIQKDSLLNGNLFANEITLDKNTQINGNISFNELKTKKDTQILGTQTDSVSLPIANIPSIPDFNPGTQDFKFKGQDNTLPNGNYQNITLEKDSRLVLIGGIYNISKLELKESSTLVYFALTTLNIQQELKSQQNVSILPGQDLKPDDLAINYKDKKDKGTKPIIFGNNLFLNFKLLAPNADVYIGDNTTLRGQIVAKKITVGKGTVVSREESFEKESDLTKVIEDEEGLQFISNEIIVFFNDDATQTDIQQVANEVGGIVIGFIPNPKILKIEVQTTTAQELNDKIQAIEDLNNPFILGIFQNLIGQ